MTNKPAFHNRDYNRDPNIQALKRRGFINQGSTLITSVWEVWFSGSAEKKVETRVQDLGNGGIEVGGHSG